MSEDASNSGPSISDLSAIEQRAEAAHQASDTRGEAEALIDLVYALHAAGKDKESLVPYVERAWEMAESDWNWVQLHRLSRLFAEIALREENWLRLYDHSANACAYAMMARNPALFAEAMQAIDRTLAYMRANANAGRAVAFCDMLLAYEEAGGLGIADAGFVEHYSQEREAAYAQALAQRRQE